METVRNKLKVNSRLPKIHDLARPRIFYRANERLYRTPVSNTQNPMFWQIEAYMDAILPEVHK
jgi:hypothetical protein